MNTTKLGVTSSVLSEGKFVLENSRRIIVSARTTTTIDIKAGFLNFALNINSLVNTNIENCDVNIEADSDNNIININFINFIYPFYNSIETNNGMLLMDKFEVATAGNKIIYIELLICPIKNRNESCIIDINIYSGDPADNIKQSSIDSNESADNNNSVEVIDDPSR